MPKIDETCSCGAKLAIEAAELRDVVGVVQGWREGHKCRPAPAGNGSQASFGFAGRDPHRRVLVK